MPATVHSQVPVGCRQTRHEPEGGTILKYLLTLVFCLFTTLAWAESHKVVVKLDVSGTSIQAAQSDVVQLLDGTEFTIKRRYSQLPYIALTCDDEGISRMEFSRTVLDISPDEDFFQSWLRASR